MLFATVATDAIALIALPQQTYRSDVQTVAIYATVRDHDGHLVPNLTRDDFQILDNGRTADISTFSNEPLPIALALMLDLSGNMLQDSGSRGRDNGPDMVITEKERRQNVVTENVESRYVRARDAAAHLIDLLNPDDRVRIGTASNQEVAISPLLTNDKAILHRILREELWPLGTARLWNGLKAAMDSIESEPGRRIVLVFSSGVNRCPPFTRAFRCVQPQVVSRQATVGEFMVYAIGGHFVLKDDAELTSTFERVIDELHHQYAIGFVPVVRDGKTHTLGIKLRVGGLTAHARKSYVAGAQ